MPPSPEPTQPHCPTCRTAENTADALERVAQRLAKIEALYEGIAEGLSSLADALDMECLSDES